MEIPRFFGSNANRNQENDPFAPGYVGVNGEVRFSQFGDKVFREVSDGHRWVTSGTVDVGGDSSGGSSAVQFPSQAALDDAQTRLYDMQARMLPEEFYRDTANTNRAFELEDWDTRTNAYINALLAQLQAELGRGNLDVSRGNLALGGRQQDFAEKMGIENLGLDTRTLQETIRRNKASEVEAARGRGLEAASTALSGYMRASELSDARRLAALQEQRALLPLMVNPNQQFFSGMGPSDPLAQMTRGFGLGTSASPIQHATFRPQDLALPPTNAQIGPMAGMGGGAMAFLQAMLQGVGGGT